MKEYPESKKRLLLFVCFFGVTAIMSLLLWKKQQDKEALYALFKIEQNININEQGRFYQQLKDIQCSLSNTEQAQDRELEMYLEVYENSINRYLRESYVDSKIKNQLRESLQYIPCDCRNPCLLAH